MTSKRTDRKSLGCREVGGRDVLAVDHHRSVAGFLTRFVDQRPEEVGRSEDDRSVRTNRHVRRFADLDNG